MANRGNLNSSRNPFRAWLKRRALKPEDRYILPILRQHAEGLLSDRGGEANASEAEKRMVEVWMLARGAAMLILAEAAKRGLTRTLEDGSWDLQPGFKELAKVLSLEKGALSELGLVKRKAPPLSLKEFLSRPIDVDAERVQS